MTARTTSAPERSSLALAFLLSSCATLSAPPPEVAMGARTAPSYSARLRVSLKGPEVRARARVLLAFRRPGRLRLEIPGPTGARLIAVAREQALTAVFPGERAVFLGEPTAAELEALLGVALSPGEVMDLLVGEVSPRIRDCRVRWGASLPRRIEATLPDGGRLKVTVEDAEAGVVLPPAAFEDPPHDGYRRVDAEEARSLWSAR